MMNIDTISHFVIHTRQSVVTVPLTMDRIELDAILAYARVMCAGGRMVLGIKYLRRELGLDLREAKHIADDLKYETFVKTLGEV